MQRIHIVTDNPKTASPWQRELVRCGYPVLSVEPSRRALIEAFSPRPADVFILDGTGVRLAPREFRDLLDQECPNHQSVLIWLITEEMAAHLDPACGIDEFIVLPSSAYELLARVRLLLWRTHRVGGADLIYAGEIAIDQANYSVTARNRPLNLTFKEYELLRFLASHKGRVFTREALLNQVWGYDYYGGIRTVDVHIRRIRAKLGPDLEDLVETVRNVGYRLNA